MKKNMGALDKMIRVVFAIAIAILYFTGIITGTIAIVALLFAVIFVMTSLVSFCPLYVPFGFNTCKKE